MSESENWARLKMLAGRIVSVKPTPSISQMAAEMISVMLPFIVSHIPEKKGVNGQVIAMTSLHILSPLPAHLGT